MSNLRCQCGHVISDTTDAIPYKGEILRDVHSGEFFDWMETMLQGYVSAAKAGRTDKWLLEQGFKQDYLDLKLSDGATLTDYIHTRLIGLLRGVYECESCGRVHIEGRKDNHFASYAPDSGKFESILNPDSPDSAI